MNTEDLETELSLCSSISLIAGAVITGCLRKDTQKDSSSIPVDHITENAFAKTVLGGTFSYVAASILTAFPTADVHKKQARRDDQPAFIKIPPGFKFH